MVDSNERSLSGDWRGQFLFSHIPEEGAFTATLVEADGLLTGKVQEEGLDANGKRHVLRAIIEGEREGQVVYFDKTYDGTAGWSHLVRYQGTVNATASEIEGRWTIPGEANGKFLMVKTRAKLAGLP